MEDKSRKEIMIDLLVQSGWHRDHIPSTITGVRPGIFMTSELITRVILSFDDENSLERSVVKMIEAKLEG